MRRFFPETEEETVESRDPEMAREKCPPGVCCFQFCDVEFERATTEEGETVEVHHTCVDYSPRYYMPPAEVWTLEDAKAKRNADPERYRILVLNMECNDMVHVVKTCTGNITEFNDGDVVLDPR